MGRMVAETAAQYDFQVSAGIDLYATKYADFPVYADFTAITVRPDVVIDFSLPQALPALKEYLLKAGLPAVLCATGYTPADDDIVRHLSEHIPVFRSANMSVGVYVLKALAAQAKKMLPDFDIEIVEKHHNQKADAPSGTALALYNAIASQDNQILYGRSPDSARRQSQEIGVHAVRGGTVAGEHEVGFYGSNETLLLTHSAQNRAVFASGALKAAAYLLTQPPGFYTMENYMSSLQ